MPAFKLGQALCTLLVPLLALSVGYSSRGTDAVTTGGTRKRHARLGPSWEKIVGPAHTGPLTQKDLVVVYATELSRLPLVHASRPLRRGIRTVVVVDDPDATAALNAAHFKKHDELYIAYLNVNLTNAINASFAADPNQPPIQLATPRFALAPLLAHWALYNLSVDPASVLGGGGSGAGGGAAAAGLPRRAPANYRWMLMGRDDTLWLPSNAVKLLAPYNASFAAAVSDNFYDFNGADVLVPSRVPSVCLPCHMDLKELVGRKHPPGIPTTACPVCRPGHGCEFRYDKCMGLAGGPLCFSKKFLGSGDRCPHSWTTPGAGMALSSSLLGALRLETWQRMLGRRERVLGGEQVLARCLWRSGIAYTYTGLAMLATRKKVFTDYHVVFDSPLAREALMTGKPMAAAAAAAAAAGFAKAAAAGRPPTGNFTTAGCGPECYEWALRNSVSVYAQVPERADVEKAAAALEATAKRLSEAAAKAAKSRGRSD